MTGIGFRTPAGDGSKGVRQRRAVCRAGLPPLSGQCGSGLQSGKVGNGGVRCAGFSAFLETDNNIPDSTSLTRTGQHYLLQKRSSGLPRNLNRDDRNPGRPIDGEYLFLLLQASWRLGTALLSGAQRGLNQAPRYQALREGVTAVASEAELSVIQLSGNKIVCTWTKKFEHNPCLSS
jgi:hypothetical protein